MKNIMKMDYRPRPNIIVISGQNTNFNRNKALRYGAKAFFGKPLNLPPLLELLNKILKKSGDIDDNN